MTAPRLKGILRTWMDERGFGFIAPTGGGAEVFVHISALPRDATRPVAGERVSYELGRGADGRVQALKVVRDAIGPAQAPARRAAPPRPKAAGMSVLGLGFRAIALALVLALAWHGYQRFQRSPATEVPEAAFDAPGDPLPVGRERPQTAVESFRCDGRNHCSQMSSCAEAKAFLKHCPDQQTDGDGDGVPCEMQWCSGG